MTYKHLTTRELTFIYNFWKQDIKAYQAAKALKRSSETVYRVYRFLDAGNSISQFQENHYIIKHQLRYSWKTSQINSYAISNLI